VLTSVRFLFKRPKFPGNQYKIRIEYSIINAAHERDWSMKKRNPPITIFGVSLRGMIATIIFLLVIFVVIDPFEMRSDISEKLSALTNYLQHDDQGSNQDSHIDATPGMVSEAMREIITTKALEHESTTNDLPTDRFFYIVELYNGGDIEASEARIESESVTIISTSGIETVLPRSSVKEVRRYKLPPIEPPDTSQ